MCPRRLCLGSYLELNAVCYAALCSWECARITGDRALSSTRISDVGNVLCTKRYYNEYYVVWHECCAHALLIAVLIDLGGGLAVIFRAERTREPPQLHHEQPYRARRHRRWLRHLCGALRTIAGTCAADEGVVLVLALTQSSRLELEAKTNRALALRPSLVACARAIPRWPARQLLRT